MRTLLLVLLALPSLVFAQGVQRGPAPGISRASPAISKRASPLRTLFAGDANTVAHVYFDGAQLRDAKGNAWAMTGAVPQVVTAPPLPAGAGPFTAAAHYSLGSGPDALDFTGDWSACFVFKPASGATQMLVYNADGVATGFQIYISGDNFWVQTEDGSGHQMGGGVITLNEVNVACVGRSGAMLLAKLNAIPTNTAPGGTQTAAANVTATLGSVSTLPVQGVIYEAWFSTTPASDALFTSAVQAVKARLGITAW